MLLTKTETVFKIVLSVTYFDFVLLKNTKNDFSLLWIDVSLYAANESLKIDFVLSTNGDIIFLVLHRGFYFVLLLNY